MKRLIIIPLVLVIISACSTLSEKAVDQKAQDYLLWIDQGQKDLLLPVTARPFLFEGEILVSQGLVDQLYSGLTAKGLSAATLDHSVPLDAESYLLFSSSWEVETWFQNYTDDKIQLVFFDWKNRTILMLVDRDKKNEQPLLGIGEVRK